MRRRALPLAPAAAAAALRPRCCHRRAASAPHEPLSQDEAPQLGLLLLAPSRGAFRQPPPPPPAHITRRLRHLARLRGQAELETEWQELWQKHLHTNRGQEKRQRESNKALRSGELGWARGGASLRREPVPYSTAAAEAYAFRRFCPAHAHHTRVMQELVEMLGEDFAPRRVIDFGCGPGAGLAAARQLWSGSVTECVGVDASLGMQGAAEVLLAPDLDDDPTPLLDGSASAGAGGGSSTALRLVHDLPSALAAEPTAGFDLAIVSSTLSELPSDDARIDTLTALWGCLGPGGVLLVQEHGGAVGGRTVAGARAELLQLAAAGEVEMLTPSPHTEPHCPVVAIGLERKNPSWLHFAQRVPNTAPLRRGQGKAPTVSESTAYFTARKPAASVQPAGVEQEGEEDQQEGWTVSEVVLQLLEVGASEGKQAAHSAAAALAHQVAQDGCAAASPPYQPSSWARIIAPPVKGKRQVTMQLLSPHGTVESLVVSKRAWAAVPGAYTMARRAEWGGLWPYPTPQSPAVHSNGT